MRQAFEKVKKMDIFSNMSDSEISEIKEMRNSLIEMCKMVNNIICSDKMNISKEHKQEILHYIDDVMMWYYSHEKPTKNDYKDKIDYVNSICDEIVSNYEKDGKDVFNKGLIESNNDTNSDKLEKLCLTLITMINNKQINGATYALTNKLNDFLKMIYSTKDHNHEFEIKCLEYINEINNDCNTIYNNTKSIHIKNEPIVSLSDSSGMSLIDLLKIKQNEEIDEMIEKQLI